MTGHSSAGPRHPFRDAVAPLALGSTWTLLRQSRLPRSAGAAPARIVTIPPTDLLCPPRRLAVGSRPPTPEGSQLAFARGDVSTPIRPVTDRLSLPPSSFTRRPVGSPYGGPTLAGGRRAYHVASQESSWVRPRLDAGGTPSAPGDIATTTFNIYVSCCKLLCFGPLACSTGDGAMTSQPQSRIDTALEISPLTVLARGVLEGACPPSFFEEIFDRECRPRQWNRKLTIS